MSFVLWAHSQTCLAILLSSVISKPVSASLVTYVFYLLSAVVSMIVVAQADEYGGLPAYYAIFPPFAFAISLVFPP